MNYYAGKNISLSQHELAIIERLMADKRSLKTFSAAVQFIIDDWAKDNDQPPTAEAEYHGEGLGG